MRLPLFLAALLLAPAAPLRAEPPPESTPAPQEAPSPAPVYARPLDEQGRAAAAPAATEGPTIDSVLSTLRQIGMLSASAVLMLLGSALAGAAAAGLVLLIRKRRASASAE